MLRTRRKSALEEAAVDMAPLIDMTFLLLIFFLVNTNFIKESGIEVERPEAAAGDSKKGDLILIAISSSGTFHMEGKPVDLASIRPKVSDALRRMPKAPVVIQADINARAQMIVDVIDECKLSGAKDINLATKGRGS